MFKFLISLFFDERGEYQPTNAGTADPAPATETAPAPDADTQVPDGQGEPPPAEPKYGEFGDDPDKVWEALNKIKPQVDQYRGKLTATERNLSSVRKALDSSGVQVVTDSDGNVRLVPKETASRQRRFTEGHKSLFDSKILEAMDLRVQDLVDEALDGYSQKNEAKTTQQRRFIAARDEANEIMVGYFPQLKVGGEGYSESFYNRATEIWENEEALDGIPYKRKPEGELMAALKAAKELGVSAQAITQAKKAGFELGKADKKILAPVGGSSSGKSSGVSKIMSREDYLKSSPEEREKFDKQKLNV